MAKIKPFEEHSSRYDDWFEKNKFAYLSELQAVKKLLPENGDGIEIGVGSGRFSAPLGIKFGVEPSARMREIAKQRRIEVVGGIAENLPFADDRFDYALMVTTICFLDDIKAAFSETRRILKPDGQLVIGFVDKESSLGEFYHKRRRENIFYRIATFYSVNEVVFHLKETGFKYFSFDQTIFHDLTKITHVEPVKEGFGQGSFIVIRVSK